MIEIINYERVNDGKKIGYVDIYLPKRKEYICRIQHLQSGDRKWFSLPCYMKQFPDGRVKYIPYWRLDTDLHNSQLMEALSEPVKEYCYKNGIPDVAPLDLNSGFNDDEMPF